SKYKSNLFALETSGANNFHQNIITSGEMWHVIPSPISLTEPPFRRPSFFFRTKMNHTSAHI
ncbi:hypothetical protein QN360_18265, partial [Glaciimonas sp. CA11.2]|uniref:hypothetical protein n=1 Tax=Glaciimonas sp. CA11.2 TaxID=3048601 RepID=UPI002B22EA2C